MKNDKVLASSKRCIQYFKMPTFIVFCDQMESREVGCIKY